MFWFSGAVGAGSDDAGLKPHLRQEARYEPSFRTILLRYLVIAIFQTMPPQQAKKSRPQQRVIRIDRWHN